MRQCMTKLSTDEDAYDAREYVEKNPLLTHFMQSLDRYLACTVEKYFWRS